jgi:hypothetical protein
MQMRAKFYFTQSLRIGFDNYSKSNRDYRNANRLRISARRFAAKNFTFAVSALSFAVRVKTFAINAEKHLRQLRNDLRMRQKSVGKEDLRSKEKQTRLFNSGLLFFVV